MPRLETLKQNQIMQVTNPTGYVSPSESGSIAGSGIRALGASVQNAVKAVEETFVAAENERQKLAISAHERRAKVALAEAEAYAQMNSKDPLGRDKLDLYQQKYNELVKEGVKSVRGDREFKIADEIYKEYGAQGQIALLRAAPEDAARGLDLSRQENFRQRSGQMYDQIALGTGAQYQQAKAGFIEEIEANSREIDSQEMVYTPIQRKILKEAEASSLATTVVRAFISRGDFKSAKEALGAVSGRYIDGDTAIKLGREIDEKRYTNESRANLLEQRAEKAVDSYVLQRQRSIIARSFSDLASLSSDVAGQQLYIAQKRKDYEAGYITLEQFNQIEKRMSTLASNTPISAKYSHILDAINRGEDPTETISQDVVDGKYDEATAARLQRAVDLANGVVRTPGGNAVTTKEKFKKVGKVLDSNKKPYSQEERLEIMDKVSVDTLNGKDPETATRQAIAVKARQKLESFSLEPASDKAIFLVQSQRSPKDLDAVMPLLQSEVRRARASGNVTRATQILKAIAMQRELVRQASAASEVEK